MLLMLALMLLMLTLMLMRLMLMMLLLMLLVLVLLQCWLLMCVSLGASLLVDPTGSLGGTRGMKCLSVPVCILLCLWNEIR